MATTHAAHAKPTVYEASASQAFKLTPRVKAKPRVPVATVAKAAAVAPRSLGLCVATELPLQDPAIASCDGAIHQRSTEKRGTSSMFEDSPIAAKADSDTDIEISSISDDDENPTKARRVSEGAEEIDSLLNLSELDTQNIRKSEIQS